MPNYDELTNEQKQVAMDYGYVALFAEHDNLTTTITEARSLIKSIPAEGGNRVAAYTALHTVVNRFAVELALAKTQK